MTQYEIVIGMHAVPTLIIAILVLAIYYSPLRPVHTRISCDDRSLSLDYKDSTITGAMLYATCLLLPILTLGCIEWKSHSASSSDSSSEERGDGKLALLCFKKSVPSIVRKLHAYLLCFIVGALVTIFVTDAIKYSVGRPRPHFLSLCAPDACQRGNETVYTQSLHCTTELSRHLLRNLKLSFPSGHSSLSAYAAAFMILYLQERRHATLHSLTVVIFALQSTIAVAAMCIGASRVFDHKHHVEDVACGLALGAIIGYFTWTFVLPDM
ncbi:phospholipid phosphatase 3-like, partial [Dermacentor andersoni]|uniref:phospholipid phosphatase 3-like n=1 Tax=Dermacentor andersoni TaxID=34620 RepID=UPI003B3AC19B